MEPTFLQRQPQINAKMRAILIDWLIQVHLRFTLLQETLYLTISVIDRYLEVCKAACNDMCILGNAYLSSLTKNLEYEEREQLDSGGGGALSQGAGHDGSFYRYAV